MTPESSVCSRSCILRRRGRGGCGQREILKDVFGNPFRPVAADPAWLTPAVMQLARAGYDERELPNGHPDLVPVRRVPESPLVVLRRLLRLPG